MRVPLSTATVTFDGSIGAGLWDAGAPGEPPPAAAGWFCTGVLEECPGEAAGAGLAPGEAPGGDAPGGRAACAAWAACAACVAGRPPTWCSTARSGARPAHSRRRLTSRAWEK